MKKIIVIALALMMVAGVVYAEDRLTLSGSHRTAGWTVEGSDWNSDTEADFITNRLRLGGKIAVADDVAVNFRMDLGDATWGDSFATGYVQRPGRTNNANQIDIDRLYGEIKKDMWELSIGQQFLGLGVSEVLDANMPAAVLRIKPMEQLKFSVIYAKVDENGSTNDDIADDTDFYAANVSYDTDTFSLKVYYGMQTDDSAAEAEPSGGGIYASTALGMLNLQAELDFFGGDSATTDYSGTQFFLAADAGLTEALKLGAEFFYAAGDDEDTQITGFSDWYTFTPMSYNTPQSGNISAFEPNGTTSPFDPSGAGAGTMGATIWADYAVMEGLKLGAKVGYWTVDEDDNTFIDSIFAWNAYVSYMIATNTNLSLTYMSSTPDLDGNEPAGTPDDSYNVGVLELMINF
jgi:hypothetical protein